MRYGGWYTCFDAYPVKMNRPTDTPFVALLVTQLYNGRMHVQRVYTRGNGMSEHEEESIGESLQEP